MHRLAVLLVGAIAAAPLAAQPSVARSQPAAHHADFSGTWNLDLSTLDPEAASMVSKSSMTITQDATTLTMVRTSTTSMGERRGSAKYTLGGQFTDTVTQNGASYARTAIASWDGPTLVLTTKTQVRGHPAEIVDRFSVDSAGKVLTVDTTITTIDSANQPIHTTQVYNKA